MCTKSIHLALKICQLKVQMDVQFCPPLPPCNGEDTFYKAPSTFARQFGMELHERPKQEDLRKTVVFCNVLYYFRGSDFQIVGHAQKFQHPSEQHCHQMSA